MNKNNKPVPMLIHLFCNLMLDIMIFVVAGGGGGSSASPKSSTSGGSMVSSSAPSSGSGAGRNYLHAENNNNNDYTRMVLDANYHHRCVRPKGVQSDAPVQVGAAWDIRVTGNRFSN